MLVDPSRRHPTPLRESQEEEEEEAAAAPLLPIYLGVQSPASRSRADAPETAGTIALLSPASRNCSSGTAAKCHPLPTSPTLRRGDAI